MRASSLLFFLVALPFCLVMAACQPQAGERSSTAKGKAEGEGPPATNSRERHGPLAINLSAAAFSPDNKYVLTGFSGGKKLLTLWEVATGKEVRSLPGHTDAVSAIAFVADGKHVLSGSGNGWLLLHEVASGKLLRSVQAYKASLRHVVVSADGQMALTAGAEQIQEVAKLWNPEGLRCLRQFGDLEFDSWNLAISPDKKWALEGCRHNSEARLMRLWDLETARAKHILPGSEGWWGGVAAFSPDSRLALVSKSENIAKGEINWALGLWDVRSGKVLRIFDGEGVPAQFMPDGKQVVGISGHEPGKGEAVFWDVASGRVKRSVSFSFPWKEHTQFFLSPDGRLALAGAGQVYEGDWGTAPRRESQLTLAIWNLDTGRVVSQWTRPPADQ
jgi:WD40 repeat protein